VVVKEEEVEEGAHVKLELDENESENENENENDGAFGHHDLMESEFFSGLRARGVDQSLNDQDGDHRPLEDRESLDAAQRDEDLSPSSLDSAPVQDVEMDDGAEQPEDVKDLMMPSDGLSLDWDQVALPPASFFFFFLLSALS
jgi:hypothetical protein